MEFRYRAEESKSWSEESSDDRSEQNEERSEGSGRSYECVFCKRGFTTAQALGGHMNIHRKDRASGSASASANHNSNKNNYNCPPSSNSSMLDDTTDLPFYSPISTPPPPNNYYSPYHQISFPASSLPPITTTPSHVPYSNQRGLSLYSNQRQNHIDKVADHSNEEIEDGLDLELRLGYHP